MFAHNIRGWWWWCSSRHWTFPPILHYMLLQCNRWLQSSSLTERHLMRKCVWSKEVQLNSSIWRNLHPMTFINACWTFTKTKQWMWAQKGSRWYISAVATDDSGSPLLVQIITSVACRLLFSASENAQLMVWWPCWKTMLYGWEFTLSNSGVLLFVSVIVSMEIHRRHYIQGNLRN